MYNTSYVKADVVASKITEKYKETTGFLGAYVEAVRSIGEYRVGVKVERGYDARNIPESIQEVNIKVYEI